MPTSTRLCKTGERIFQMRVVGLLVASVLLGVAVEVRAKKA